MRFDPWTFAFQLVNFVALLMILKRLLYRPVREIMEKRRALAAREMDEAERARREAAELKERHLRELREFQARRLQLEEEMKAEVAQKRRALLEEAVREARGAAEREEALQAARKARAEAQMREGALEAAGVFALKICRDIADRELHRALLRRFLPQAEGIAAQVLRAASAAGEYRVEVLSAFPLEEEEARALREAFGEGADRGAALELSVDADLIAGVSVRGAGCVFDASLVGQVAALTERLREGE